MAEPAPTLSQGLAEHIKASGETLEYINKNVFERAGLMAGIGYLEQLIKGYGDMPLNAQHHTEGAKALAAYLLSQRARLNLPVLAPQPMPRTMETSGEPIRSFTMRKPQPPRSKDND